MATFKNIIVNIKYYCPHKDINVVHIAYVRKFIILNQIFIEMSAEIKVINLMFYNNFRTQLLKIVFGLHILISLSYKILLAYESCFASIIF